MSFVSNLYASIRIFTNIKLYLIREIFRKNNYKMSNKNIVETIARIASAYQITFDNSNCINNAFSRFLLINARNKIIYGIILI